MPGSRAILNGLSECATENGDLSAAKRAAKQMTEFFPAEAGGWANLAMILGMTSEPEEAIAAVDHAIELAPADVTFRMIRDYCIKLSEISAPKKEKPQDN
jgi:Flp pilus assembly protein TadD